VPSGAKTTLATIIANELGVGYQQTSGPALQIQGDLTAILTNLKEKQVLFLDEIHRLQPVLEEKLYTALEDYKLDIIIGQGPAARTHVMEIKPFTFVGATTRPGMLSSPLRGRFGILLRLEFYTDDELRFVVERSAEVLGVPIDRDGAAEIAMRSRGTPRIANRLLRRVRDYAQVRAQGVIDRATASRLGVSPLTIDSTLSDAFAQAQVSTTYMPLNQYHVVLEVPPEFQEDPDALKNIYVKSTTGAMVPLSAVTHFETQRIPLAVNHQSQSPATTSTSTGRSWGPRRDSTRRSARSPAGPPTPWASMPSTRRRWSGCAS